MIPIIVKITSYLHESNDCIAQLQNGNFINLDPFVGCAMPMTDVEYAANKGAEIVGKSFLLTAYSVYPSNVVPHENGMQEVSP